MQRLLFLISITIIIAAVSCKSPKQTARKQRKQTKVDSVFVFMKQNEFDTEYFTARFKGMYQRPEEKRSFNGQIRIKKDSIIWISITAIMNVEVFRLEIKPDSFTFINRLEKTYINNSTDFLRTRFGVDIDFEMLQSVLLGNDFPYYENDVFKLINKPKDYQLSTISRRKIRKKDNIPIKNSKILVQNIWINKENYKISKQVVKIVGSEKTKLRVNYSNYAKVEEQLFPMTMLFRFKEDKKTFVEFNFTKINTEKIQRFPFRISRKYTQEKIEERK